MGSPWWRPDQNCHIRYAQGAILAHRGNVGNIRSLHITTIGNEEKNVFTLMGSGGHGMNTAPGSAMVLADFILGKSSKHEVFNRFRRKWNGGLIGPYIAEMKYKYLQMQDYFDVT